jgi:hypothetical protein
MPGLVPGIQPAASAGAHFALDRGNECRDDTGRVGGIDPAFASPSFMQRLPTVDYR